MMSKLLWWERLSWLGITTILVALLVSGKPDQCRVALHQSMAETTELDSVGTVAALDPTGLSLLAIAGHPTAAPQNRSAAILELKKRPGLAGLVVPCRSWYIIPIAEVARATTIYLSPHRPSKARLEKYREAWHLMSGRPEPQVEQSVQSSFEESAFSPQGGWSGLQP
jgi:hypothetical protein